MKQLINAWCFEHKPVTTLVVYGMEGEYKKKKKKVVDFIKMPLEEDLKGHWLLILATLFWHRKD